MVHLLDQVIAERPHSAATVALPLPADTADLIRLAAAETSDPRLADAARLHGLSAVELQQAILRFIVEEFFTAEGGHYRSLGLNPGADLKQITRHYRLLIRIFHPDRSACDSADAERYTARINRAYAELRGLKQPPRNRRPKPRAAPCAGFGARPLRRPRLRFVLLSAAFVLPLLLLVLMLSGAETPLVLRSKQTTTAAASTGASTVAESAVEPAPRPEESVASRPELIRIRALAKLGRLPPAPSQSVAQTGPKALQTKAESIVVPVPPPIPQTPVETAKPVEEAPQAASAVPALGIEPDQDTTAEVPAEVPTESLRTDPAPDIDADAPAVLATVSAEAAPQVPLAQQDAYDLTIQRFAYAFERGDIELLMTFFNDQTRATSYPGQAASSPNELRWEYHWAFLHTSWRKLHFYDLRWQPAATGIRGIGQYTLQQTERDTERERRYSGTAELLLQADGEGFAISRLLLD